MKRMATIIISTLIFIAVNGLCSIEAATDKKIINNFIVKLSIKKNDLYKGVVIGKLNFIEIEITNQTDKKYRIGKYFRALMTMDENNWSQFSMAASGEPILNSDRITYLKYGYGANSIAKKKDGEQSIMIHIGNMNSVVNDTSPESKNIALEKWWPEYLLPSSSITITWPTFWFTDSTDKPLFLAIPSLISNSEKYFCWVNFQNNKVREISANTQTLIKILSNTQEPVGLRSATIAWLMEEDKKNEKHLLPYITNEQVSKSLGFRAMQSLMVWGSPQIIDEVFSLWKNKKIPQYLDKDMQYYFTWSSHKQAQKYKEKVVAGNR